MSNRNHKAIFERYAGPADDLSGAHGAWDEVCREMGSLSPLTGREFIDAAQIKGTQKSVFRCEWSPTTAKIDTACRMKISHPTPVNEQEPNDDKNFRIFGIETISNVMEKNRRLELVVVENV